MSKNTFPYGVSSLMPKLYTPLPEVEKAITRPMMFDIIRQIKEITNITKETRIFFAGLAEQTAQNGSMVKENTLDNTVTAADKHISIDVNELFNEDAMGQVATDRPEQIPIFLDNLLGIEIKPIYLSKKFEISFTCRFDSKRNALAWRDGIHTAINMMRDVYLHETTYHYGLPVECLAILEKLHTMREAVAGYGETFTDYFLNGSTNRLTEITDQVGQRVTYAIAEKQIRIQGMFNFTVEPSEIGKGDDSTWESSFSYNVTIDVPVAMNMKYPVMVHNQLLDEKWFGKEYIDFDKHAKAFPLSLNALHGFESNQQFKTKPVATALAKYPSFDDWLPKHWQPHMLGMMSVLCQVDKTTPKLLLNLHELGTHHIESDVLQFLKEMEWEWITKPFKSIFQVNMFMFHSLINFKQLKCDKSLNITHTEDLSERVNHRVVIGLDTDLRGLDIQAYRRMKLYPEVMRKLMFAAGVTYADLAWLYPRIDLFPFFPEISKKGTITPRIVVDRYKWFKTVMISDVEVFKPLQDNDPLRRQLRYEQPRYSSDFKG